MDMIDQIGGWRSVGGVGVSYGEGYEIKRLKEYLINIGAIVSWEADLNRN